MDFVRLCRRNDAAVTLIRKRASAFRTSGGCVIWLTESESQRRRSVPDHHRSADVMAITKR
ncbi:MAG TPA: hypothetical protein VER26_17420, partial [Xanthobacteraceae bacterium]|nr:hypothetical protein [Xanthobacteraceae bacterium]